jgi:hypothetical protein
MTTQSEVAMEPQTKEAYEDWQKTRALATSLSAMLEVAVDIEKKALGVFWGLRLHELKTMPYVDYLSSPEWEQIRKRSLMLAENRCQVCEATGVELHVHHKTYERRGEELPEDLIVLCKTCHTNIHDKEAHDRPLP